MCCTQESKLARAPRGGRGEADSTPCRIFSIAQKNGSRYQHETFSTFSSINFASTVKFSEKFVEKFLRKWRFSDVMLRDFGSKSGKCFNASRMYRFEVKHNLSTLKDVKLSALQISYLRFLMFFDFDPQNLKFHFFKNNCL